MIYLNEEETTSQSDTYPSEWIGVGEIRHNYGDDNYKQSQTERT